MDRQLPSNYGQYLAWIGPVAIHLSVSSAVEHKNDDNNVVVRMKLQEISQVV